MQWNNAIPFLTLVRRSLRRMVLLWSDNFIPPILMSLLALFVFGYIIGGFAREIMGLPYLYFIVPGLLLTVIGYAAYSNVLTAIVQLKLQNNIEILLTAPIPKYQIALGYILGGCVQGFVTTLILILLIRFFVAIHIAHLFLFLIITLLISSIFCCIGFLNSLWVRKYDNVFLLQGMIITPLIYLGCTFYPIAALPPAAKKVILLDPIVYLVDLYRYTFFNIHEISLIISIIICVCILLITFLASLILAHKKIGLVQKK